MKPSWQIKKLSEICSIVKGKKPVLFNEQKEDMLPYLGAKFLRGTKDAEFAKIDDKGSVLVDENDLIIICDGSKSGDIFSGFKGILSSTMGKMTIDENLVDRNFLRRFLDSNFELFNGSKKGAAIPHLDFHVFKNLKIPLPPLTVQQKIVARLDELLGNLAEAKRLRQEVIADTEKILSQTLREIFEEGKEKGWEENKIGEILHIKHGWAFKGEFFGAEGDILLTPGNFKEDGGLYFTGRNTKRYSGSFSNEFILSQGDLVVVMTDLSKECKILGNPAIVTEKMLHNQRIGKIEFLKKGISKGFLYYFFLTKTYKDLIKATATGTTVRHTAPSRIYEIQIQYPSLAEQQKIVTRLNALSEKLRTLRKLQQSQLEDMKKLEKAYLREAFRGELC